jgi:hypothetical protein
VLGGLVGGGDFEEVVEAALQVQHEGVDGVDGGLDAGEGVGLGDRAAGETERELPAEQLVLLERGEGTGERGGTPFLAAKWRQRPRPFAPNSMR